MQYIRKYYHHFLRKRQVEKLHIFGQLLLETEVQIGLLSDTLDRSTAQIKHLVVELKEDIMKSSQLPITIDIEKQAICIPKDFNQEQYFDLFVRVRKDYFDESPYFQLLMYLFKMRSTKMIDISEALMFSISYCYKLIDYLNHHFLKQGIPMIIKKQSDLIHLSGSESVIRMYQYYLHILAYNIYVDFEFRGGIDFVAKEYQSLKTTYVKHNTMFAIIENAIAKGNTIENIQPQDYELFQCIKDSIKQEQISELFPTRNKYLIQDELIFYALWTLIFIPENVKPEEKLLFATKFKEFSLNKHVVFAQHVLADLNQVYALSPQTQDYILFEIVMLAWGHSHLHMGKFMHAPSVDIEIAEVTGIKEMIDRQVPKEMVEAKSSQYLSTNLAQLLFSYIFLEQKQYVYIGVSTFNHPEYLPLIKNTLHRFFNPSVIQFTNQLAKADVLISDGVLSHMENQRFAYLGNIYSSTEWENVCSIVQKTILTKNISASIGHEKVAVDQ